MEPLRAVDLNQNTDTAADGSGSGSAIEKTRRAQRGKPARPLPTDRMRLDVQRRVLRTIASLSVDRRPVSAERLSDAMNKDVSHYTVTLSHGFFVTCGWLTKPSRGEYIAADSLILYSRRLAADPDDQESANEVLRDALWQGDSWFWPLIFQQVEYGPARLSEVLVVLMTEAQVGHANRAQVRMLLDWLVAIGMITIDGDRVALRDDIPPLDHRRGAQSDDEIEHDAEQQNEPVVKPDGSPGPRGEVPKRKRANEQVVQDARRDALLTFSFGFSLTAEDLAKLTPEQIEATFAAVGKLMAIKPAGELSSGPPGKGRICQELPERVVRSTRGHARQPRPDSGPYREGIVPPVLHLGFYREFRPRAVAAQVF